MAEDNILKGKIPNAFYKFIHKKYVPASVYILLLIAATVNVSLRGGTFSYVFFYATLLYLPLSLVFMIYTVCVLAVYQETDNKLLQKNVAEHYRLTVENTGFVPIGDIEFYYNKDISGFTEDFAASAFRLLPRQKVDVETEIVCRYSGAHDIGIDGYVVRDIFGVLSFRLKLKVPIRVHVLPPITDVAAEDIERSPELSSGNLFRLNRTEDYLGNDTRKYVKGDSLSRIHWRNYARSRKLLVRLPENSESEMLRLILLPEPGNSSIESLKRRDAFLEYVVSVGEYFGMRSRPLMIYYYNQGVKNCLVDSPESFREFYTEVPVITSAGAYGQESVAGTKKNPTPHDQLCQIFDDYENVLFIRESDCKLMGI